MARKPPDAALEPDLNQAVGILMELIRIPGVSGREGPVAAEIVRRLRRAGLPASAITHDSAHRRSPAGGERGNLIVRLPGTVRRPRRLLSAHMDTVALCAGARPVRRGGRIVPASKETGLGGDDRAGTAILLTTLLTILRRRLPHPPLTFLWTVQEELGLQGARNVAVGKLGRPAMGFNFDGFDGITAAATGAQRVEIDIFGIASHAGAAPEKGVSAITIASLAIAELHRGGWLGAVRKGPNRGTSNVGVVQAGSVTNAVCPRAALKAEVRSHDPAFRKRILEQFRKSFTRAARNLRNDRGRRGRVDFRPRQDYEAFRLEPDCPALAAAVRAARAAGVSTEPKVSDGGLDANWLTAHGIPTVTFGTGSRNAHTTDEYVQVDVFERICRAALRVATDVS